MKKMKKKMKISLLMMVTMFALFSQAQPLSAASNNGAWVQNYFPYSGYFNWDWKVSTDYDTIHAKTTVNYDSPFAACLKMDYRTKSYYSGSPVIDGCTWGTQVKSYTIKKYSVKGSYSAHRHSAGSYKELTASPTRR